MTEQGPGPPENPTQPKPTGIGLVREHSGWFRVLIPSYFRVQVGVGSGVGSYKYISLNSIFSFEKNPTLLLFSLPPLGPQWSV